MGAILVSLGHSQSQLRRGKTGKRDGDQDTGRRGKKKNEQKEERKRAYVKKRYRTIRSTGGAGTA